MAVLADLLSALKTGAVEIVDLTNKLTKNTPSLTLPPQYPSSLPFVLEEIAAYDNRGPFWKAHDINMGEHTGTHIDVGRIG